MSIQIPQKQRTRNKQKNKLIPLNEVEHEKRITKDVSNKNKQSSPKHTKSI